MKTAVYGKKVMGGYHAIVLSEKNHRIIYILYYLYSIDPVIHSACLAYFVLYHLCFER